MVALENEADVLDERMFSIFREQSVMPSGNLRLIKESSLVSLNYLIKKDPAYFQGKVFKLANRI